MIILVKCLPGLRHKFTEHPWVKARSTVKYNEGPEGGYQSHWNCLTLSSYFLHFFPFTVIESPSQWLKSHFPRATTSQFTPSGLDPHNEFSVAPFLVNKSAYLPMNSCMYLIPNNCNRILLVKRLRKHCPEFLVPQLMIPGFRTTKKTLPIHSIFLDLSFCFPLSKRPEFLVTLSTLAGPQQLTWEVKSLWPMDY